MATILKGEQNQSKHFKIKAPHKNQSSLTNKKSHLTSENKLIKIYVTVLFILIDAHIK